MNGATTTTTVQSGPSQDAANLRGKVVEILAGMANGCLTELGYYPGMPQKMQELERQNAKWQQENVKLFQDNQSLTRALQECKESKQAKMIQMLQKQIQGLTQEGQMLLKQNQSLLAGQPSAYHQLLSEYQKFQEFYQQALQEIAILRHNNALLNNKPPPPSPLNPGQIYKPIVNGNAQIAPNPQPPNLRSSMGVLPGASPSPSINTARPVVYVPSPQIRQTIAGQAHLRNQATTSSQPQHAPPVAHESKRSTYAHDSELNLPRSISRTPIRSQPGSRPGSSASASRPAPPHLSLSTASLAFAPDAGKRSSLDGNMRLPAPMSAPPLPQRQSYLSGIPPEASSSTQKSRSFSMDSAAPSRTHSLPSSPTNPMGPSLFVQPLTPLSTIPTTISPSTALPPNTPTSHPVEGVIQQDPTNRPSLFVQPLTRLPATELPLTALPPNTFTSHSVEGIIQQDPTNSPLENIDADKPQEVRKHTPALTESSSSGSHESASPAAPFEAITPEVPIESPFVSIVQSPHLEQGSFKRPNTLDNEIPHKKPRLDVQEDFQSLTVSATGCGEMSVSSEGKDDDDDEESEDEEIRVGPDGLRVVEDCLPALIDDNEKDSSLKTCKLCTARFTLGYTADEPKPFVNATTEQLVQHCSSEHQSAWETLRNTV